MEGQGETREVAGRSGEGSGSPHRLAHASSASPRPQGEYVQGWGPPAAALSLATWSV